MGENFRDRLLAVTTRVSLAPEKHHVYALWANNSIVYVGYTKCLPQRLAAHLRANWADYDAFTHALFDSKLAALDAEAAMIREFAPILNINATARRGYVPQADRACCSDLSPADMAAWEGHCAAMAEVSSRDMLAQIEGIEAERGGAK